ncbi:MAG: phosphate acetyltransferase [Geminicoccaceae bacterium]
MAAAANAHIVLSEGEDERVVEAGLRAAVEGIARISVVADPKRYAELADGRDGCKLVEVHHPTTSSRHRAYADAFFSLRKHKGVTPEAARVAVASNLVHAAMMVRQGDADGTIGGAVATTADTVRTALQIIGRAPGTKIVSSFFLMILPFPKPQAVAFADCALVIQPNAEELASIAVSSARSYAALTGNVPRVALLSFSTMGSAEHDSIDCVRNAVSIARSLAPDLVIEGEIQFDAAIDREIRERKAPGSALDGDANVFIFPNLSAGNIGYKIAQRAGGATAIGPMLQGLAKPANDLSRGCSADDIYQMIAVTAAQCASNAPDRQ